MNLMSYNLRAGGNGPTNLNGENNPMFGRNDQCHGIIKWSKDRTGINNVEVFGEIKAREISAAISKAIKGKPKTAEHRAKISTSHIGISTKALMTPEQIDLWKQHMSESQSGKKLTEEHKYKIGKANKGKKRTAEFKEQMRKLNLGRKLTAEQLQKLSKALKGKKKSVKTRQKMSQNNAMHGHSVCDFMTPEEIEMWKKNIGKAVRGRKKMIHPLSKKQIFVKPEDIEKYIAQGFILGGKLPKQ